MTVSVARYDANESVSCVVQFFLDVRTNICGVSSTFRAPPRKHEGAQQRIRASFLIDEGRLFNHPTLDKKTNIESEMLQLSSRALLNSSSSQPRHL